VRSPAPSERPQTRTDTPRATVRAGAPTKPKQGRWLLRRPSEDAAARLFCFPYSGVGASMYTNWPDTVGPAEVCLLQLPGRENRLREPHYGDYDTLAEQLLEQLSPYLDRPYAFFGHCGGALPGFATTLRLIAAGMPPPAVLFMSSQVAPHQGPYGRFLSMSEPELAVELEKFVHAMGGTPHPDLIALGLRVLVADVAANKGYRLPTAVTVPCQITALSWQDDQEVAPSLMGGWAECAEPGRFRQVVLPGSHYSFLNAPPALLAELAADLDRAVAGLDPAVASRSQGASA
jgi:surfactin synthase thioesterase subunit